jgi:serine/threonine-protein kinase RsbW
MSGHTVRPSPVQIYGADFDASLEEVSRVGAALNVLASARGGVEWATLLDLGLAEAMTNVVRHGYGSGRGGRITLSCFEEAAQWRIELRDFGAPIPEDRLGRADGSIFDFDPNDIQNIPEGGMGLALIRACFDSVDYRTVGPANCLTLTKRLMQPAE